MTKKCEQFLEPKKHMTYTEQENFRHPKCLVFKTPNEVFGFVTLT